MYQAVSGIQHVRLAVPTNSGGFPSVQSSGSGNQSNNESLEPENRDEDWSLLLVSSLGAPSEKLSKLSF